jgi:hypothetical protein
MGARNTIIAKLSPSGALLSGAGYGTSATGVGIGADATGNVLAAGYFTGPITLGGLALPGAGFSDVIYLAKLAP